MKIELYEILDIPMIELATAFSHAAFPAWHFFFFFLNLYITRFLSNRVIQPTNYISGYAVINRDFVLSLWQV